MKNKKFKFYLLFIFIIAIVAFVVSKYFFQLMLIQGKSMEPTYKNFSLVIVDKRDNSYERGDVIAFKGPDKMGVLVKRIVAVPGDKVLITGGRLYVNGNLSKDMIDGKSLEFAGLAQNEIILCDNAYFVLGDNYDKSKDSRYEEIGTIDIQNIIGKIK